MKAPLLLCLGLMAATRVASEGCESSSMYPCNNGICLTGDPKFENKERMRGIGCDVCLVTGQKSLFSNFVLSNARAY